MMDASRKNKLGRSTAGALASVGGDIAALLDGPSWGILRVGEKVRAARPLRNDGTYPHRDVGAILVREGDVGHVLEIVKFCGALYYTVEFVDRDVVVGARRWDLARSLDQEG
ncbi:MAG: nitrogen fixation protein NifZ [Hyphomicrobium sp.]|jgi:nitrogen fixation protein NifZ